MPQEQNAGWSRNIRTDNSSSERVEELKYLGTTLTNQNFLQEEIKSTWKSECLLSFRAESFVFQFAIQKYKYEGIQNDNFTCCYVWVWNMAAHIEGGA